MLNSSIDDCKKMTHPKFPRYNTDHPVLDATKAQEELNQSRPEACDTNKVEPARRRGVEP